MLFHFDIKAIRSASVEKPEENWNFFCFQARGFDRALNSGNERCLLGSWLMSAHAERLGRWPADWLFRWLIGEIPGRTDPNRADQIGENRKTGDTDNDRWWWSAMHCYGCTSPWLYANTFKLHPVKVTHSFFTDGALWCLKLCLPHNRKKTQIMTLKSIIWYF